MSEDSIVTMNIVDRFLQASLLSTIGHDERRYESLKLTVHDLTTSLSKTPPKLIEFSRVAFQPTPNEADPMVTDVYAALKVHWKLIDNVYTQERPLTVLRAIMLQAVANIAEQNERLASILYHANISAFPHHGYGQAEIPIVRSILEAAGEAAEAYGLREFKVEENGEDELPEIKLSVPAKIEVDLAALRDGLVAAVGPRDQQGQVPKTTPVNPYWPNSPDSWSYQFPPIAAPAIANAVQRTVQTGLSAFAVLASKSLNNSLQRFFEHSQEVKGKFPRDLNILWWMQALYSSALRHSYRDIDVAAAAFQMPHDLIALDVVPCPESVVHILGEAARSAVTDHPEDQRAAAPLSEWLKRLHSSGYQEALKKSAGQTRYHPHHASLLEVSRDALGIHWSDNPQRLLGELANAQVTPRQLAMWLFRDLIAERLARVS